jgi:signal recognition particle subunit SRP54
MMVGLQGSGKTTTTGKLAKWLAGHGHRPMVVSTDVYRPAAREQLAQVAKAIGAPIWPGAGTDKPLEIVRGAIREAKLSASDVILVDTAGRLHIDEELMVELSNLKRELTPSEILFVADAMTGQDAVRSAGEFHRRLGLTGVVLTKLDGDARGGAALSIGKVTGAPVKFVGTGEKYDALDAFYPDRIVSRVLGMGDVLSLIERVEHAVDEKQAAEMERKLRRSEFTLEDFRDQLRQVRKMGPLEQVLGMLPKVGPLANLPKDTQIDESRLKRVEAVINSMTSSERADHGSARRQAPKTHRARQRHHGTRRQSGREAVPANEANDEAIRFARGQGQTARLGRRRQARPSLIAFRETPNLRYTCKVSEDIACLQYVWQESERPRSRFIASW